MNQATLAPGASARLIMLNGSPCSIAEFVLYTEQCEYHEDPNKAARFVMAGANSACAIELDQLSGTVEAMTIFGQELDHFSNLNYLMQKAGWTACSVITANDDINARLLARLVNVEVNDSNSIAPLPASTLHAPEAAGAANVHAFPAAGDNREQPQPSAIAATGQNEELEREMETHQQARDLLIERNGLEERCEILDAENRELRNTVASLTAQLQAAVDDSQARSHIESAPATTNPEPSALLRIIDKHLLRRLDIGAAVSAEIVTDLRSAGYDVRLSLVAAP